MLKHIQQRITWGVTQLILFLRSVNYRPFLKVSIALNEQLQNPLLHKHPKIRVNTADLSDVCDQSFNFRADRRSRI